MKEKHLQSIRHLGQQYAYSSIKMHEAIAQKAGLSGTDHKYLGFLLVKGEMTAGELGELSGLSSGAVTGLIDRFEQKKLIKRQFSKDDRRKVIVLPDKKKIQALLEPLFSEFGKQMEDLIASFSKKELEVIAMYLHRSIEIMTTTSQKMGRPSKK